MLRVNNSLCVVLSKRWRLTVHYSNDGKQLISDTYVRGHISIPVTLTRNCLYLIPKHVLKVRELGLVPPTVAPFSFEMDVVLVGVALFLVCISSDFHLRARANVCVFVYPSVCLCVCVCVGLHCLCLCVCASANGESELVHRVRKYISHLSDQSQSRGLVV